MDKDDVVKCFTNVDIDGEVDDVVIGNWCLFNVLCFVIVDIGFVIEWEFDFVWVLILE